MLKQCVQVPHLQYTACSLLSDCSKTASFIIKLSVLHNLQWKDLLAHLPVGHSCFLPSRHQSWPHVTRVMMAGSMRGYTERPVELQRLAKPPAWHTGGKRQQGATVQKTVRYDCYTSSWCWPLRVSLVGPVETALACLRVSKQQAAEPATTRIGMEVHGMLC